MARNKDLPSKLRRANNMKQSKAVSNWIIQRTKGKVRTSPYSRRTWRNTRLKRD
ncbi:MAG: 50S ribosomal protein L39e [Candidatus Thorarchaeota archaeon]